MMMKVSNLNSMSSSRNDFCSADIQCVNMYHNCDRVRRIYCTFQSVLASRQSHETIALQDADFGSIDERTNSPVMPTTLKRSMKIYADITSYIGNL